MSMSNRGTPSLSRRRSRTTPSTETTMTTANESRPLRRDHNDSTGSLSSFTVALILEQTGRRIESSFHLYYSLIIVATLQTAWRVVPWRHFSAPRQAARRVVGLAAQSQLSKPL